MIERHFRIFIIVMSAVIIVLLGVVATLLRYGPQSSVPNTVITVALAEQQALIDYAYGVMDGAQPDALSVPAIGGLEQVYATVYADHALRCSWGARSNEEDGSTAIMVRLAVERCLQDDRFGGVLQQDELTDAVIILDLLHNGQRLSLSESSLKNNIELGIHALEIQQGDHQALFKSSVPITKNYDLASTFAQLCAKAGLPVDCSSNPKTQVTRYNDETVLGSRNEPARMLLRMNDLSSDESITNDVLRYRLVLAEGWLKNDIDPATGMLAYYYSPSSDATTTDMNHLRQMATMWAMTELGPFLSSDVLNDMINTTVDYYSRLAVCDELSCFVEVDGDATIAHNSFLILALIRTGYADNPIVSKLAQGILNQQRSDGSFATSFLEDDDPGVNYYPGEALLALAALSDATGESAYREAVARAFLYYRDHWRLSPNTAMIPWHTQAYALLYDATEDEDLAAFIGEMNDWLIANYQVAESYYADELGGFPYGTPGNPSLVYLEGMNDAYRIARDSDDADRAERYAHAIQYGTQFILSLQYTDANAFYLPHPDRAIGGVRTSLVNNTLRNDNTQHFVRALMKTIQNGLFD